MSLRLIALAALVGASAASFASFDLFIAPDASQLGYARYDPINRVSLGSISVFGGSKVTAVSAKPNGLYQYTSGWMQVNNSTGERVSIPSFSTGTMLYNRDGSVIASYSSASLQFGTISGAGLYSLSGSWSVPSGFNLQGVTAYQANRWLAYGYSSAGLGAYLVSDVGTTVTSSLGLVTLANMGITSIGQAASFSHGAADYAAIPYRTAAGAHNLFALLLTSNTIGSQGTQLLSGYNTTNANTSLCAVAGHTGFFVVGADAGTITSARISEFDDAPGFALVSGSTTAAFAPPTTGAWRMSNLVAPEPAEWMAMGVGLVALLGRRRRR